MDMLEDTKKIAGVDVEDYDAIYLTGGHGVMFDFTREDLGELMARIYEQDKVVSTVLTHANRPTRCSMPTPAVGRHTRRPGSRRSTTTSTTAPRSGQRLGVWLTGMMRSWWTTSVGISALR